jgi:transketolase
VPYSAFRGLVSVSLVGTGLLAAIGAAKAEKDRPSIIKVRTTIGFGSKKQGTEAVPSAE